MKFADAEVNLPHRAVAGAREHPVLMLPPNEAETLENWEKEILQQPLQPCPVLGSSWIGTRWPTKPGIVSTGVCLPTHVDVVKRWLAEGIFLDSVFGIELAARVANETGAELHVWIPRHEVACELSNRAYGKLVLRLAECVRRFITVSFPQAKARWTDEAGSAEGRSTLAELYPGAGPRHPWGSTSDREVFWTKNAFLQSVLALADESHREETIAVVLDSDQVRCTLAAAGLRARLGLSDLSYCFFSALPRLGWRDRDASAEEVWARVRKQHRRMYKAAESHPDEVVGIAASAPTLDVMLRSPTALRGCAHRVFGSSPFETLKEYRERWLEVTAGP